MDFGGEAFDYCSNFERSSEEGYFAARMLYS
jgi:hypothetical protein